MNTSLPENDYGNIDKIVSNIKNIKNNNMENQQIEVKYYKPFSKIVSTVFSVVAFVAIIIFVKLSPEVLMHHLFLIVFFYMALMIFVVIYSKKNEDKKGKFTFRQDGVLFEYGRKKDFLYYDSIKEISREWYEQQADMIIFNATQSNGNEYRIYTSDKTYILRVAHCEEKAYRDAAYRLTRKIYKDKRLERSMRDVKNKFT